MSHFTPVQSPLIILRRSRIGGRRLPRHLGEYWGPFSVTLVVELDYINAERAKLQRARKMEYSV